MSMFSQDSARAIGLDVVKQRWPHLTGAGVKLLQVEWDMARADHINAVRDVILGIAPAAEVRLMSEREYLKHLCGWFGFGAIGWYSWKSKPAEWDIECHAYTGYDADPAKAAALMDERISGEGVRCFVAGPNGLADIKPLWLRSRAAHVCGTPTSVEGSFPMGGTQPGRYYPDMKVPTQWTSIAAPAMAAAWALVEQACTERWVSPPAAFTVLNGVPRVDHTIAAILGEPVEKPAPEPVETWETKRELLSVTYGAWAPSQVEQSRATTEHWHIYEKSSLGNLRGERIEDVNKVETRVLWL